ncbi:MAG TPA: Sir2 family NAD-dependent protein deacetylase [Candidatus Angelobacter sp.]|jgi:NAD-dependent deacetylase|nr:Sir2 family NAD-dependent protein deacetylase [Candidatus Angelobacter sp.]
MIRQNSGDDRGSSLRSRSHLFVLTGAGISAESGIPVFQGTSWRGHSHYELANIEAWESDPQLVWEYYSDRRARARDAKPNAAHIALAGWEKDLAGGLFLCTQNVDGLHEAAESQDVVHIHGKLFESRCAADCGRPAFADHSGYAESELPRCACRALVRPNVCWFGEQPYHLDRIYDALQKCEVFVAIGTSGSVQPVASFVTMLKQRSRPARTVFLGLTKPANAKYFDEVYLGPAAEIVPQVVRSLNKLLRQD